MSIAFTLGNQLNLNHIRLMTFHQSRTNIQDRQFLLEILDFINLNFVGFDIVDKLLIYDKIMRIKEMIN